MHVYQLTRQLKRLICFAVGFGLICAGPSHAVKQTRLWLPKSYLHLMPRLIDAANMMEARGECLEVLDGHLDVSRSTLELPVFRIVCRGLSGRSYSTSIAESDIKIVAKPKTMMKPQAGQDAKKQAEIEAQVKAQVDAEFNAVVNRDEASELLEMAKSAMDDVSEQKQQYTIASAVKEVLDKEQQDVEPDGSTENAPEEVEEESLLPIPLDREKAYKLCMDSLELKTRTMLQPKVYLRDVQPDIDEETGVSTYRIPFDALSPADKTLRYVAVCNVHPTQEYHVAIKPRSGPSVRLKGLNSVDFKQALETIDKRQSRPEVMQQEHKKQPGSEPVPQTVEKDVPQSRSAVSTTLEEDGWEVVE